MLEMVTAVISPQGSAGVGAQRRYSLPICALAILEKLEAAGPAIDAAQKAGQGKLRLTFNISGKSARVEIVSLIE